MNIPDVIPRRPLDDDQPDLYLESDTDFVHNNMDFVLWALEHHNLIRDLHNQEWQHHVPWDATSND
jgi:hypothetical protein